MCRSIELSLKSHLALNKVTIEEIKSREYGHDLEKLFQGAAKLGLTRVVSISDAEGTELRKANQWYNRKGFEYFDLKNITQGKESLPDITILEALAQRLIEVLEPICKKSAPQP